METSASFEARSAPLPYSTVVVGAEIDRGSGRESRPGIFFYSRHVWPHRAASQSSPECTSCRSCPPTSSRWLAAAMQRRGSEPSFRIPPACTKRRMNSLAFHSRFWRIVRLCSENSEPLGKTPSVGRREPSDLLQPGSRSRLAEKSVGSTARHHLQYSSTGPRG